MCVQGILHGQKYARSLFKSETGPVVLCSGNGP